MRLTEKNYKFAIDRESCKSQQQKWFQDLYTKLSQLEDIEEELGIDIITLFKALKNGIYSKGGYYSAYIPTNSIHFIKPENIELGISDYDTQDSEDDYNSYKTYKNELCLYEHLYEDKQYVVRVNDYGKTWALTKEELL